MEDNKENVCCAAPTLIFACSGAADVGAIADRAARKLTADGAGKMYCLAGIGGRVPGILKTTEEAGFTEFEHLKVTDLGLEKGKSPATDENVATVAQAMLLKLGD